MIFKIWGLSPALHHRERSLKGATECYVASRMLYVTSPITSTIVTRTCKDSFSLHTFGNETVEKIKLWTFDSLISFLLPQLAAKMRVLALILLLPSIQAGYAPQKAPKLPEGVSFTVISICPSRGVEDSHKRLTLPLFFFMQFCPSDTGDITATTGGT